MDLQKVTLKLAIVWAIFFSLNALGTCMVASLTNVKWVDISLQAKFLLIVMIFINWSGSMMAFLSKTVARLETPKPTLAPDNGTSFLTAIQAAEKSAISPVIESTK